MDDQSIEVFSYEQFEDIVRKFSAEMPECLLRHRSTTPSAFALQRLRLIESLDTRFTVAIVGQMRVGKSTLLNALIGKDLAPTGVTETTATINRFSYGHGEVCGKIRVHWTNHDTTDVSLAEAGKWIGLQENSAKTRYLEFFADTDFLKIANIVDTPGTRSVIQTHTDATQGFLAEKLEEASLRYGGSADAVVYAINPVGRESDCDLLQMFGERTRLPGASAYNSIAVVQKWEHLQPDPLAEVAKKCRTLKGQLEGKVAEVIPTSGLLARHVAEVPLAVWQQICDLCIRSSATCLDTLLLSEQDFADECEGAGLDESTRRAILTAVSWRIVPLCVNLARREYISDGASLQSRLHEASGIPALLDLLQRHFFSRARLIKASTILRKAWEPCEIALLTLRREIETQSAMVQHGRTAKSLIEFRCVSDPALQTARQYVEDSLAVVERDIAALGDIQREVDALKYRAMRNFELFDRDIESLKLLETQREAFSQNEAVELDCLFGQAGPDLWSRLAMDAETADRDIATTKARERWSFWSMQKQRSHGSRASICDHACDVLGRVLNHLEA